MRMILSIYIVFEYLSGTRLIYLNREIQPLTPMFPLWISPRLSCRWDCPKNYGSTKRSSHSGKRHYSCRAETALVVKRSLFISLPTHPSRVMICQQTLVGISDQAILLCSAILNREGCVRGCILLHSQAKGVHFAPLVSIIAT